MNKNTELLRNGVKSAIEIVREGGKRRTRTNTAAVVPSALMLRSNVAEPRNDICRERTGNPLRLERYCRQFPGAKGAPRSCPAGSITVAGLRWCGGRREPNGGSQ